MAAFGGLWRVVSSPDFDDEYLRMQVKPYIELRQEGQEVSGEYQVGLQSGGIDGKVRADGTLFFSFEGMDEMDEVNGAGTASVKGDRLSFSLKYHLGDEWTFECKRETVG